LPRHEEVINIHRPGDDMMRRTILAGAALTTLLAIYPAAAQPAGGAEEAAATQPAARQAQIPVKMVVLFSSGVGYFEHFGSVAGEGRTELRFKTQQINDILKSLVLQDLDGGRVATITYPSQDPVAKTLKSFQVDITANPSLAELLNQLRGAKVTVSQAAEKTRGTILGVEKKKKQIGPEGKETIEQSIMNVITDGTRAAGGDHAGQCFGYHV
jgi:hypothetical protein